MRNLQIEIDKRIIGKWKIVSFRDKANEESDFVDHPIENLTDLRIFEFNYDKTMVVSTSDTNRVNYYVFPKNRKLLLVYFAYDQNYLRADPERWVVTRLTNHKLNFSWSAYVFRKDKNVDGEEEISLEKIK